MHAEPTPVEFTPPPTPGLVRAVLLAVGAHAILLGVLAAGLQWKRGATPLTVEAELWSDVPTEATTPMPSTQTVLSIAPASPAQPAESTVTTTIVIGPGADGSPEKPTIQQDKTSLKDQLEQEKRRKDALQAPLPREIEEAPVTDDGEVPARDPT